MKVRVITTLDDITDEDRRNVTRYNTTSFRKTVTKASANEVRDFFTAHGTVSGRKILEAVAKKVRTDQEARQAVYASSVPSVDDNPSEPLEDEQTPEKHLSETPEEAKGTSNPLESSDSHDTPGSTAQTAQATSVTQDSSATSASSLPPAWSQPPDTGGQPSEAAMIMAGVTSASERQKQRSKITAAEQSEHEPANDNDETDD